MSLAVRVVALVAFVLGFGAPAAMAWSGERSELVVGFDADVTAAKRTALLADAGATRPETVASSGAIIIERVAARADAVDRLAGVPGVRWAVPNLHFRPARPPLPCEQVPPGQEDLALIFTDPLACRQWYLSGFDDLGSDTSTIAAAESWPDILNANGSVIAVIDSGVDFSHPDLIDRAWTNPEDGTRGFDIPGDTHAPRDSIGHGTMVAGVAAASADDTGTAGACPRCKIMDVKTFPGSEDYTSAADILDGIETAAEHGAQVINLSLGVASNPQLKQVFVDVMRAHPSIVFVVAAGNARHSLDTSPESPCDAAAEVANGICVASLAAPDQLAYFSNYGSAARIAAPGEHIYAPSLDGGYDYENGTSFSAPLVSGSAALLRGMGASARQSVSALIAGARPAPGGAPSASDPPRLNVTGALEAFRAMGPDTDPDPIPIPKPSPIPTATPDPVVTATPTPRRQPTPTPQPSSVAPTKRAAEANPALLSFRRVTYRAGRARVELSCRAACTLTVRVYTGSRRLLLSHVRLARRANTTLTLKMSASRYRKLRTLTVRADGPGYTMRRTTRRVGQGA